MIILLNLVLAVLVLLCLFVGLVILLQRPRADSGLGAAIGGGGMVESTFGADSTNVLTKTTVWGVSTFFVVAFLAYLGFIGVHRAELKNTGSLPVIEAPADAAVPSAPTGQLEAGTPEGGNGAVETGLSAPVAAPAEETTGAASVQPPEPEAVVPETPVVPEQTATPPTP